MLHIKATFTQHWKTFNESWRFAIIAFLVLRLFYAVWSWMILTIQPLAVQNVELFGEPVLTIFNLENSRSYTYRRELEGEMLTFQAVGNGLLTDLQTGGLWDISTGTAIAGHYQGLALTPAEARPDRIFPYHGTQPHPHTWLALWQRFDANWYTTIAETGYGSLQGDIHFPPLYPLLIRVLQPLIGSAFLAGLLISHAASLYAIKLLYEAASELGGAALATRSTLLFLIYPTSFFLFSAYTESLFLVTAILSLRQMRRASWVWAGFWTFCAILTRLQGVVLVIPMLYLMWRGGGLLRQVAQWLGLALPAIAGFFYLFLRSRYAASEIVPLVETELHARLGWPWEAYGYALRTLLSANFTLIDFLNWTVVTFFAGLLVIGWRKIPFEYTLYVVFSLLVTIIRIVETQPLNSMLRYSLALFPAFFILGMAAENPWAKRLIVYISVALNLYLSAQFFLWGWVA